MKTEDLISEAISLPVEERAMIVESLLKSLHQPDIQIDEKWKKIARTRLQEIKSGKIKDD